MYIYLHNTASRKFLSHCKADSYVWLKDCITWSMTSNLFPTVAVLENNRLQSASETQFLTIARELKLSELAKQVAGEVIVCPAAIDIIAKVAPIRALGQAALRYHAAMGPLADYLLEATKYWAMELGGMHGPECLPVSGMTFAEALKQEAELMTANDRQLSSGSHSDDALSAFRQALSETETSYTDQGSGLRFRVLSGAVGCECFIGRSERAVSVCIYSPIFVPAPRRGEVAEALAWANWQCSFGGFEMDHEDGQVRFHYALPLIGQITVEHARMMLSVATTAMRRYGAAICELALTDHDPHGVMIRAREHDEAEQKLLRKLEQAEAA